MKYLNLMLTLASLLFVVSCSSDHCKTCCPGPETAPNEFAFVRDGTASCVIVLPAEAGKFERQAAEDLRDYLKQMSGAEIAVLKEGDPMPDLPRVYIGQTAFTSARGVDFSKLGEEEYQIFPAGRHIVVTGGRPIGSFYGVWNLLNRLGVWSIAMDQDVVPEKKDVFLEIRAKERAPAFSSRIIYNRKPIFFKIVKMPEKWFERYGLYLLRNGINGRQHRLYSPPYIGKMSDIPTDPYVHTFCLYVPRRLFDTHPEYFAMDKTGKRRKPEQDTARGGLCLSNREMWDVALSSLRAMIKKHRAERPKEEWPILYDISALDLAQACECPECRKIAEEEGTEIGLLSRFINYVAENIRKEYPDIIIRTLSYGLAKGFPKKTPFAENVLIQVCDLFVAGDCFKPLSHPFNAPSKAMFDEAAKQKCQLSVFDYWNMCFYCNPPRMEVVFDTLAPDLRYLKSCGVSGLFLEGSLHEYKPQNFMDLEYFVAAQLMMDPDQDPEMLADVFLNGYYGAAAPEMKKLFNELREGVKKYPELQPGMRSKLWDYMTPEWLWNTWELLEKAASKAPEGSLYRRRVQDESLCLLWLLLEERGKYLKYFNEKGMSRDQVFELCKTRSLNHLKRYGAENLMTPNAYVNTQYHCEAELNRLNMAPLPVPPKFAEVESINRRVFGIYQYNPLADYDSSLVDDPDSPTGKALKATDKNPANHGAKTTVRDPRGKWAFRATQFGLCDKGIVVDPVPQDEKYHWYKIPDVTLQPRSWFWGYLWHIQIILHAAYQIDDGVSKENLWDCWFSAKFTGPAYVPGSKKENAVWVDTVVLTRPGETKIKDSNN